MAGVADQPDVADAAEAVTAFHDPEAALDGGTDRRDRLVEPALPRLQRLVAGRPVTLPPNSGPVDCSLCSPFERHVRPGLGGCPIVEGRVRSSAVVEDLN